MKKIYVMLLAFLAVLILPACSRNNEQFDSVLRIYNWQEYIDDALDSNGKKIPGRTPIIDLWKENYKSRTGKTIKVVYDTFETNETMLNMLKTGKSSYDLICPSEYTIQKMIQLDMLEKFDKSAVPNYTQYASPYVQDLFERIDMDEYVIGYMWGTMGLIYNPSKVSSSDVEHWSSIWNSKYKNKVSIKDSVRDTYCITSMYVHQEELISLKNSYETGAITQEAYNNSINDIMNRCDDATIGKIEAALKELKKNIYGFEVDNGKNDIVQGKIDINLAWSGDAVYSIDLAEEEGVELAYAVPVEGSNIWFDGWVMPKDANKELAQDFVNFICQPEIAVLNMEKIGYTSSIAGNEVFEMIKDWYEVEDGDKTIDLSWFFGDSVDEEYYQDGKLLIKTDTLNRQLYAQYPDFETVTRCGVMNDFGNQTEKVLQMWNSIKGAQVSIGWYIAIGVVIVVAAVGVVYYTKNKNKYHRTKKK